MANFVGLGQSVSSVIVQCADNNDKKDIASFLVMQQDYLQGQYNDKRIEDKKKEAEVKTAGNNAANTAAKAKDNAGSAFARMKALAKQK